ncbi:hypothetical protein [Terracidiphilus sp.]|uniref:hypothetical protein n=1 Tax=Terracidiphilus sp. TaxID=1964191 RepID=UPI003C194F80
MPQCPPAGPPPIWNRLVIGTSGAAIGVTVSAMTHGLITGRATVRRSGAGGAAVAVAAMRNPKLLEI